MSAFFAATRPFLYSDLSISTSLVRVLSFPMLSGAMIFATPSSSSFLIASS